MMRRFITLPVKVDPESAEAIDNVNGDRMLVQDCFIHDIPATGLYAKGGATGMIVERCLIKDCGGAGVLVGFDTSPEWFDLDVNPDYYENIDGTVRNCIIVDTRYSGIGLYAAKNAKIYNNTLINVAQLDHSALFFGLTYQDWEPYAGRPPSLNPVIRNNIFVLSHGTTTACVYINFNDELGGLSGLSGMPVMSNNRYCAMNRAAEFKDERPDHNFVGDLAQWQGPPRRNHLWSEGGIGHPGAQGAPFSRVSGDQADTKSAAQEHKRNHEHGLGASYHDAQVAGSHKASPTVISAAILSLKAFLGNGRLVPRSTSGFLWIFNAGFMSI